MTGLSGGGYVTLCFYMKSKYKVKKFTSWSPITDLEEWYYFTNDSNLEYADLVLNCTGSSGELNIRESRKRSPFYMKVPRRRSSLLEIYHGINDNVINFNQSIKMFEKLTREEVSFEEGDYGFIGEKKILFEREKGNVKVVIFDGSHEMVKDYNVESLANS